jgi:hypothetical protein
MPVCGSGAVVSAWSLLIRRPQRACRQAETPLIVLCRFPGPALAIVVGNVKGVSFPLLIGEESVDGNLFVEVANVRLQDCELFR